MASKSKAMQRFFGMVHSAQQGEMKNPSTAVRKAASSMRYKDVKDFASTKLAGLKEHVMLNLKRKLKKDKV